VAVYLCNRDITSPKTFIVERLRLHGNFAQLNASIAAKLGNATSSFFLPLPFNFSLFDTSNSFIDDVPPL
jgi:hypothetical protein